MKNQQKIPKTTLIKIYKYLALNEKIEVKNAARDLNIDSIKVLFVLENLCKLKIAKKRTYKDMGVTYYYPSKEKLYPIFCLSPIYSYMYLIDPALNVRFKAFYYYNKEFFPEKNIEIFLKNALKYTKMQYEDIPAKTVYFGIAESRVAIFNKKRFSLFKLLKYTDMYSMIKEMLNKEVKIFHYPYHRDQAPSANMHLLNISKFVSQKNHLANLVGEALNLSITYETNKKISPDT